MEVRGSGTCILWFENTDVMSVGVALANLSTQSINVEATVRDESGVTERLAQTAQRRGTVEFHTSTSGQISVLGPRFNPVSFTTIPVLAK